MSLCCGGKSPRRLFKVKKKPGGPAVVDPQAKKKNGPVVTQQPKSVSSPDSELRSTPPGKQLPPLPATDSSTRSRTSREMPSLSSVQQTFGPFFVEYSLQAEYNMIKHKKLPGVYVVPSQKCAHTWFGVVFIRQGLYQGGVFKFTMNIPDTYPDSECPGIVFDQCIYHPMIHPDTGQCDVKRAYPKWRKNVNHLWEVVMYSRRIFHKVETKEPLNADAASVYENDLVEFKRRIAESIEEGKSQLYKDPVVDDPHAIRFSSWDPDVHGEAQKMMLSPKEKDGSGDGRKNAQTSGLSWMVKGSCEIFAKKTSSVSS